MAWACDGFDFWIHFLCCPYWRATNHGVYAQRKAFANGLYLDPRSLFYVHEFWEARPLCLFGLTQFSATGNFNHLVALRTSGGLFWLLSSKKNLNEMVLPNSEILFAECQS